jgi:hypothetical protein
MKDEIISITSLADLNKCLIINNINLSLWGTGNAKSIMHLYEELINGECRLNEKPFIRVLPIVQVLIFQNGKLLVETEQELFDNRIRKRNLPPSEKMKPEEDWITATIRCIEEELSISQERIKFVTETCLPVIRQRNSQSYPGLLSQYHIYRVEVLIDSLPHDNFWTDEKKGSGKDNAIRRHKWGWMNPTTITNLI